jgi:archaellin
MNTKYAIPVLVAAVAVMVVVAAPYALAESDVKKQSVKDGAKYHKFHAVQVDGFVGSIQLTADTDKAALKDRITVSLSEASSGIDAMKASIGVVSNESGDRFLAWTLVSMDKDENSDAATITIHIVDAGNADNKVQITKEFDVSKIKYKMREG